MVTVCRYGGDEIGLAFMNVPPELRKIINAAISGLKQEHGADINFENGIKDVRGYFDRGGVIQEENVDIKLGIAELSVPTDPVDRTIFWEQFNLGLILDPDEIKTIRLQRESDPTIPSLRQSKEILIADHEGFVAYAEKLKQRHPEMVAFLDQLVELQKDISEIKDQFPEYVNNILYDRLLGEKVTGFQDLTEHLTKGSFKEMFMFDMKGIKEFNDVQSIATGDQAIVTLWNSSGNQIGPEDFAKVMCFRRGSTFIVGIRDGVEATQDLINRLQSIRSVNFQGNDFNIGFHHRKVERTFTGDKQGRKEIRNWLEESIVDTHENWNQEIITKYLRYNRDILNEVKIDKGTRFTPEQGLALFFNGKRAIERYDRLIEVTTSMGIDAKVKESTQTLGPNEWTSEEYIHLKKQVLDRLFTVAIPHKLEEYESKSDPSKRDEIKIRETLNKRAELAKKYNYPINTD
jgi:GGDEF domain-containing protein